MRYSKFQSVQVYKIKSPSVNTEKFDQDLGSP